MAIVTTAAEMVQALANTGDVSIEVTQSLDITSGDITSFVVPNGVNATITINEGVTITGVRNVFDVTDGGSLTLNGAGTIIATTKNTNAAIVVQGEGSSLTIDGVTIDVFTHNGKTGNYAFGIYAVNKAVVTMKSGIIKAAYGSCISTNNTTGGASITITGGSLLCDGSYALYLPSYGITTITGGTVQGINARMGEIYISGNAKIIKTALTEADYDDIGSNIATSGCIWLGDTIALVMGTYTDPNGTVTTLRVSGYATVQSDFRAAIGIYLVDTKEASNVSVTVANPNNVTTTAAGYSNITTYDHDYIAAAAQEAGKAYDPVVESTVQVVGKTDPNPVDTEPTTEEPDPTPTEPEEPDPTPTDPDPEEPDPTPSAPEGYEGFTASDLKAISDANSQDNKTKVEQIKETVTALLTRAKEIAAKGGYETTIPFNAFSIPWKQKYSNDVMNQLTKLGFKVNYTFYANNLSKVDGINLKWN